MQLRPKLSFAAVLLFLRAWAQVNQAQLDDLCDIYYDACTGLCDSQRSAADSACNGEADNPSYGQCFFNHEPMYLDDTDYKTLALCLVENTKTTDWTCFKNETIVVDCDWAGYSAMMDFNLAPLGVNNVIANTRHDATLNIDWGEMNVTTRPIFWNPGDPDNGIATSHLVPHMNLHACQMTDQQKTCSALMLESTQVNATIDLTTNNLGNAGQHQLPIFFPNAGTWTLLAHIQLYEDDSSVKALWDISKGLVLEVQEKPVTPSPTIPVESENERTTGGNNTALIICLILVAICAGGCGYCYWFGGFGDSYDEDYDGPEEFGDDDDYVDHGVDERDQGVEMGSGHLNTKTLETAPKMDQVSPLYAKLMANANTQKEQKEDLPPAPAAPGNSV